MADRGGGGGVIDHLHSPPHQVTVPPRQNGDHATRTQDRITAVAPTLELCRISPGASHPAVRSATLTDGPLEQSGLMRTRPGYADRGVVGAGGGERGVFAASQGRHTV